MSYDVSIGGWDCNYTHNSLGAVCYAHLCRENGLRSIDGLIGQEALPMLEDFWASVHGEKMSLWKGEGTVGEPDLCAKYDSENGWGSFVGSLIFMGQLTAACARYPRREIVVSA